MTLLLVFLVVNMVLFITAMIKEDTHSMCATGIIMLFLSQTMLFIGLVNET